MFVQITDNKLMAWAPFEFEGYTDEIPEVDYTDYMETPDKFIFNGTGFDLNPDYAKDQTVKRQEEFLSQFFAIEGYGYFRKQPKGYGSAVESLNTAFNVATIMKKLPANTLTFYKEPDFSDETQCTEEWLVKNSYKNKEMTGEEFAQFYAAFMIAWNSQEHQ